MKKLLLTATCLAAIATTAHADDRATWRDYLEFNPYVGADFQHSQYSYHHEDFGGFTVNDNKVLDQSLEGGNIHVGNRFNKFVGVELGYFLNAPGKKSITTGQSIGPGVVAATDFKTKIRTQGGALDLLGYLPVGPRDKFDLIGTGGVTYTHAKLDLDIPGTGSGSTSDNDWGYRAGGGLQFHVTPQFNIRGLARYQSADFDDTAKHAITYTLGANFEF